MNELIMANIRELKTIFSSNNAELNNPFIGERVLVRTYSAGVHIGTLISAHNMECHLKNALRLWKWEGGALSFGSSSKWN